MAGQGAPSTVEYALALLILLLMGVALLSWLQPVLSDPTLYSPVVPVGMRGLG
jgi:hypothetical protein